MGKGRSLLPLLAIPLVPFGIYIILAVSAGFSLRRSCGELQVGMSAEDVVGIMGKEPNLRYDGPRLDYVLTEDQKSRCNYTLVFSNPYAIDPAIYCYFDADDFLVASHRFE